MELLKPIAVKFKDPAKLPDTSRNSMIHHIKSPQNPAGRFIVDTVYDVYGITEVQARSWSFLLVAETNEMVWIDMEYVVFAEPTQVVKETTVEVAQAPKEVKLPYKRKVIDEHLGHA
jgi:hypothetical protein